MSVARPGWWASVRAVIRKDLLIEWRTRSVTTTMLLFVLLVLFIFSFAVPRDVEGSSGAPAGVLWVAILFASVIGTSRVFGLEEDNGCLAALRISPVDPAALFVGKLVSLMAQLTLLEVVALPAFLLFYGYAPGNYLPGLVLLLLLGTMGIAAVGSLLSAMTTHVRAREFLLPLLLFPISIPLLLALVRGTADLLAGLGLADIGPRLWIVIAFDVAFLAASTVLCEFVLGGE